MIDVRRLPFVIFSLAALATPASAEERSSSDERKWAFFTQSVEPIFERHCYRCHSHKAKKARGGLVLDSRRGWEKGGQSGPALVPGKPDDSLLVTALRHQELKMPPKEKLPDEVIATIIQWIEDGAHDPRVTKAARTESRVDIEAGRKHWAFQPLKLVAPAKLGDRDWPRSRVDQYILAKMERAGAKPVEDADHYTWLRRVSFDLTGLPPTLEEIRAFVADSSLHARERVVDRLLESRAFGERWTRHWLDLVGYADQVGTSNSVFAQHAWRYRDYVIDSLNEDVPFDRFVREQIAGDLLDRTTPQERADALTATGFLVLGDVEIVEADKAKLLVDIVDQQLNKVGKAFLGLTLECARCHDHKFDPIPQTDYYAMAGFFHSTSSVYKTKRGVWSDVHVLDLPETPAQQKSRLRRQEEHRAKLDLWKKERAEAQQAKSDLEKRFGNKDLSKAERDSLEKKKKALVAKIAASNRKIPHAEFFSPTVPKAHGVKESKTSSDMRITIRGNPRALGEPVPRGFLQVASRTRPTIPPGQSGRRELAEWISTHPLTARVTVNRIWQKLFGEGIVRSVDYFGIPGDRPSHPELLDYLADQFMKTGWSRKRLIRSLVLSRTYGLASSHSARAHSIDPDNRLLWRMNRVRLDAEALRDGLLAVSGRLVASVGGPALPLEYPENVGGLSPKDVNPPNFRFSKWRPEQEFQRTIYLPVIRHAAQPGPAELRNVFDFAQPSEFRGKRDTTAVPTQALFLLNSPIVKKHAAALASRLDSETDETVRLELLWMIVMNRPITKEEKKDALAFLAMIGDNAWVELCHALLASNEFLIRL